MLVTNHLLTFVLKHYCFFSPQSFSVSFTTSVADITMAIKIMPHTLGCLVNFMIWDMISLMLTWALCVCIQNTHQPHFHAAIIIYELFFLTLF